MFWVYIFCKTRIYKSCKGRMNLKSTALINEHDPFWPMGNYRECLLLKYYQITLMGDYAQIT